MAGMLWITDRDPGIRALFGELLPEAESLSPADLDARLRAGQQPDAIVVDGTQLLELTPGHRRSILASARVLVCTGMPLSSLPAHLVAIPGVAVLAKPFCAEDLEAALEWVRGATSSVTADGPTLGALVQRRRPRGARGRLPAR